MCGYSGPSKSRLQPAVPTAGGDCPALLCPGRQEHLALWLLSPVGADVPEPSLDWFWDWAKALAERKRKGRWLGVSLLWPGLLAWLAP